MKPSLLISFLVVWQLFAVGQDTLNPPRPDTTNRIAIINNTLLQSEIDIPLRMDLRPVYEFANRMIDTLYTSPNYPTEWVMQGCDTRYQYRFVRGPLQFKAVNNLLYVSFSGYYGLRGSTRVCTSIGNTPWTPACSCGFGTEKPRRIDAGFVIQLKVLPDYKLGVQVNRSNPVPVDKCEVCFFAKDVTQSVVTQLRAELDSSISSFQRQLGTFSLRPYMQIAWDSLQAPYAMQTFGFLDVQPSALRIGQVQLRNDSLYASIGLSARPELKPVPNSEKKPLPPLTDFVQRSGFRLYVAQSLPYNYLSSIANAQMAGKEFQAGKGLFKKTVRVDSVELLGDTLNVFLKLYVSKSAKGVFYLQGTPRWQPEKQELVLENLDFHVDSRQWLLRSASWLLDGAITQKLNEYARFNLSEKSTALVQSIASQMNRNIYPGINSKGFISRMSVDKIEAVNDGIFVQGAAEGRLWLDVDAGQLIKNFTH